MIYGIAKSAVRTFAAERVAKNIPNLLIVGNALDRGGITVAGRALQKHRDRVGSVFPKVTGSPATVNAHGEAMLQSIITNPNVVTTQGFMQDLGMYLSSGFLEVVVQDLVQMVGDLLDL